MMKGFIETKTATDNHSVRNRTKLLKQPLQKSNRSTVNILKSQKQVKKHIGSNVSAHSEGDQDRQKRGSAALRQQ